MTKDDLLLLANSYTYPSLIKYLKSNNILDDVKLMLGGEISQHKLFDYLYPERIKTCNYDNIVKFSTFAGGYRYCGKTSECKCNRECSSAKLKHKHLSRTDKEKESIKTKTRNTFLSKYNGHPMRAGSIKEKVVRTNIERYGCESSLGNSSVREKIKATNLLRYGTENPLSNEEIYQKSKDTRVLRYNDANFNNRELAAETKLKRHGDATFNNRRLAVSTSLGKFGEDHYTKTLQYKINIRRDNTDKWGNTDIESLVNRINSKDWLYNEYVTLQKTATQISEETGAGIVQVLNALRRHSIEVRHQPGFSIKCIQWLESIMHDEKVYIAHALNEGERYLPEIKCRVDGFCDSTNTVYEFYGNYWHGNPKIFRSEMINERVNKTFGELFQSTIDRENLIKNAGYTLISIWEDDWNRRHK